MFLEHEPKQGKVERTIDWILNGDSGLEEKEREVKAEIDILRTKWLDELEDVQKELDAKRLEAGKTEARIEVFGKLFDMKDAAKEEKLRLLSDLMKSKDERIKWLENLVTEMTKQFAAAMAATAKAAESNRTVNFVDDEDDDEDDGFTE